ncbi:MAG TPA: NADH-quinone oxidoreductase subunit I [Phycisphaerae bacterium]|nr:NADH-quinone oxidoreductase subunit I [Phycisphaerae bacterium]
MREYFRNIYLTVKTVLIGMQITLKYCFARTVTVQYPDMAPVLQPRFRGIHYFEIEKCIACDQCARACPVDCIYIQKTAPRKIDKATGVATGGAITRFAIDYAKCMFCALCTEPCPTECIHMGNVHAMAGYDRESMLVEFTELAKQGLQTPEPLWARSKRLPAWAEAQKREWLERAAPVREFMRAALTEQLPPKTPAAGASTAAATAPPAGGPARPEAKA